MKPKLSRLPSVGKPLSLLEGLTMVQLRAEHRMAKAQEARFVETLSEHGVPTRPTTPADATEAERKDHRLARLSKKTRSFYRYLVAWRRYIRIINDRIKFVALENRVAMYKARLVAQQSKTPKEVVVAKLRREAELKSRAETMSSVRRLRAAKDRYVRALSLSRGLLLAKNPASRVTGLQLLRVVLELQPKIPGARAGKATKGLTLAEVDRQLAIALEEDRAAAVEALALATEKGARHSEIFIREHLVAQADLRRFCEKRSASRAA